MTWRRTLVWLLPLLLAGCTLLPPTPSLPTPVRPPEIDSAAGALPAALGGDFPPDALTLRYEIGNPAWEGRTTLTLHGSGAVEVTFAQGEGVEIWQSSLDEDEFLALVRLLVDHELWSIHSQRDSGVPDEAYPTITVEAEGFEPLVVGMWDGEAESHPDFKAIREVLAGLALELSGGVAK